MVPIKKNILFYIGELGAGGAERVLIEILTHLDRKKYNLFVVVNRSGGYFYDKLPDDVVLIDRSKIRGKGWNLRERVFGLSKIIYNHKIDLVVAILISAGRSLLRIRPFVKRQVKMTVRIDSNPQSGFTKNQSPFWRWIEDLELKIYLPRADGILAVSEGIKKALTVELSYALKWVEVIHNPVDLTKLELLMQEQPNINTPPPGDFKLIVAAGRLIPEKDYNTMLKAYQKIRERVPCRLIILGDGPLRNNLETEITSKGLNGDVFLPGYVENPWSYISRADLYLSTSISEGFHLSIVEAMACGVVPVATDCDYGPREIITDGIDGRLVPVGDVEAISDAVTELLLDPDSRNKMALKAKERARDFDISVVVKDYEKFFDSLV